MRTFGAMQANWTHPLCNYEATRAPGKNDDLSLGYEVGSLWVDVSRRAGYICVDATVGNAVWKQITQ